jgi:hypothetical protein
MQPSSTSPSDQATAQDKIRALSEAKWLWASDDQLDRLEDLFDDELVFVHLNGRITSKPEWMNELRARRFVYDHIEPHETSVRAYGDAAVVAARGTFTVNGAIVFKLVCTEVYAMRGGQWKLVSFHACSDGS